MKRPLLALLVVAGLCSCVKHPGVKITTVDGVVTEYTMGTNLLAEENQTVALIEMPGGPKIKFMQGKSDATKVADRLITAAGTAFGVGVAGKVATNAADNAAKVDLGAQGVQINKDNLKASGDAFNAAIGGGAVPTVGQAIPPGGVAVPVKP